MEGPEDRALGRVWRLGVVYGVNKEGKAEDIREEDEFLPSPAVSCVSPFTEDKAKEELTCRTSLLICPH